MKYKVDTLSQYQAWALMYLAERSVNMVSVTVNSAARELNVDIEEMEKVFARLESKGLARTKPRNCGEYVFYESTQNGLDAANCLSGIDGAVRYVRTRHLNSGSE